MQTGSMWAPATTIVMTLMIIATSTMMIVVITLIFNVIFCHRGFCEGPAGVYTRAKAFGVEAFQGLHAVKALAGISDSLKLGFGFRAV